MHILLVEDDQMIGDAVVQGLQDAGLTVDWLTDGETARLALQTESNFDLLLLDINLPRLSGLNLLQWLREQGNALPVLIMSARDQIDDRVAGLDGGADDYLVKPFSLAELTARVRALLRRQQQRSHPKLVWRDIELDPARQSVLQGGEPRTLTASEYRLLYMLMSSYPHLLSRRQIEDKLYGWQEGSASNTLEVHLSHLRRKLGADILINVRGLGWRLASEKP
ncbi:response regulator transcription factor [Chitinimonas sp.]|uniref:response regulator transcription factor n=1 Tax=Chitinimonas sp. TaxID=1934313 RepID=UPI002F94E900